MPSDFGHVGFLIVMALVFPLGGIITSYIFQWLRIRPQRPNPVKEDTYECGIPTEGSAWVQFNFRYYLFALLFVIFDVEVVFLFPWAIAFKEVALAGFIEVLTFLVILGIGLVYAWRKRALEWL